MWKWINETLLKFENCFNRKAAFRWFTVIVIGLMLRRDDIGLSSMIRELNISPRLYETMLHFFRASSWTLEDIRREWMQIVKRSEILFREQSKPILIGDGVKQSKEAKKMPCVKKMFQESENSSKPNYIFGHMFGAIGVLIGSTEKLFCVPVSMTIQDGNAYILKWLKSDTAEDSHVVRIIREACYAASIFTPSILLLDRYFLTVPALLAWIEEEKRFGHSLLTIVTKAKSNAVAYEKPVQKTGRGRPAKKGGSIKLSSLFGEASLFTQTDVLMYGKTQSVQFLCRDLLWGKGLYHELRFVLVKYRDIKSILVCTDTSLSPEQIIRLYSYRFKIESCFREFKQVIAGFSYRFWCKSMPNLNPFLKRGDDILENMVGEKEKVHILSTVKAIEGFVMLSCIAIGIVQICSFKFSSSINASSFRWLRTRSNKVLSEATTVDFMRKSIFYMFQFSPNLHILHLIRSVQSEPPYNQDSDIA